MISSSSSGRRASAKTCSRYAGKGAPPSSSFCAVRPYCGSNTLDLVAPAGSGTVHAVTTVRRKADAGGDYNVCIVELDEGVRLMSRVEGVAPDAVQIGQRVRARVARVGEQGLVVFDPEAGQ